MNYSKILRKILDWTQKFEFSPDLHVLAILEVHVLSVHVCVFVVRISQERNAVFIHSYISTCNLYRAPQQGFGGN